MRRDTARMTLACAAGTFVILSLAAGQADGQGPRAMRGGGQPMGGMGQRQGMMQGGMGQGMMHGPMRQGMMQGGMGQGMMQGGMNQPMAQQQRPMNDQGMDQDDPATVLAHKDALALTEDQVQRLEQMRAQGKHRAGRMLTAGQKRKFRELADAQRNARGAHGPMIQGGQAAQPMHGGQGMQPMHGGQAGQGQMPKGPGRMGKPAAP